MSVNDILSHDYNKAHIYTHMHTHILTYTQTHTHTPTHLHKVLPTIYYSCRLMIISDHKSCQQYFDIFLNCKKLTNFIAVKRKENK